MKTGIVPELCHWQPSVPFVRRVMDRTTEIHLHALVHALTLAVRLGVVGRRVEQFGTGSGEELAPEVIGEDLVAVGDDGGGDAVQLHHIVPEGAPACVAWKGWCRGMKCENLVKRSTTIMIVSKPSDHGRPSTKSMVIKSQGAFGNGSGSNSPGCAALSGFACWQTRKCCTACLTKDFIPDQRNSHLILL